MKKPLKMKISWISVKDKLPDKNRKVEFKGDAIYHISDCASLPSMGFIGSGAWERDSGLSGAITHWRYKD